ncbi:MAG TPA: hypothetical protein PKD91_00265 [Bacteroidia bacterium]|nr:hypothetical protein [Bacteroidia bacterium]
MKSLFITLSICLLTVITGTINAQSSCAVQTHKGRFFISDKKANPPTNIYPAASFADVASVQVLEDGKLLPLDGWSVKSFSVTIIRKNGNSTIESKSNLITEMMQKELSDLKTGDKVYVENIKANTKDGKVISMPALDFIIQ